MKLRETLLAEHSKAQCNKIVAWVGNNQLRFDELFKLFLQDEYRVVQRAAWPISYCVIKYPILIKPHWKSIAKQLCNPNSTVAVKRNILRFLEDVAIPTKYEGEIMDACFRLLNTPTEAIAVKCFSMTVLDNLSKIYPEILPELKESIVAMLPYASAGVKSRANKILKKNS